MTSKIGILREIWPEERRVAAVPDTIAKMIKAGMEVLIESNAGMGAHITDEDYSNAGATVVAEKTALLNQADIVLKVQPPLFDHAHQLHELDLFKLNSTLLAPLYLAKNTDLSNKLVTNKLTAFSLDRLPRVARAQSMDILSSMSNIAG